MAKTKSSGSIGLRNNKLIFGAIFVLVILIFLGALSLLRSIYETETYYVLNQDVPTRTQISPDMLEPIVTSKDSAPVSAKTVAEVQTGGVYTRFPLLAGDILTDSNITMEGQSDIASGIPDEWVVTSFSVDADNAVGGRIHRGDYFDMMIANNEGSYYPFVNILALDTTISLSGASSNKAAETEEAHSGQTSQYVVGMSPQDAARLHQIVSANSGNIKLVLAPRQNQYNAPRLSDYTGVFSFKADTDNKDELDMPKNMGKGTDYTFSPIKRDEFGRPIKETDNNCSTGNGQVTDPEICKNAGTSNESSENSTEENNSETTTNTEPETSATE